MNNGDIRLEEGDIVHWWGGGLPNTPLGEANSCN